MSRSLLGFLLFCLLLVIATAGVVWYMGPTLAGIVADSERRESPYYLLQLLPAAAARAPREQATRSYRSRFVSLAAEEQGRLLWQGGSVEVAQGSVLLDVAGVQLLEFATGVDLVQMLTSSAYRDLAGGSPAEVLHLGSPDPPGPLSAAAASVLVLYRVDAERADAPLGVPGETGWLALLPDYRGTVRWQAPVATVHGSEDWNRVLLMQFPRAGHAQAWLEDPNTATERAIARRQVDDMLVLLVQPSGFAPR